MHRTGDAGQGDSTCIVREIPNKWTVPALYGRYRTSGQYLHCTGDTEQVDSTCIVRGKLGEGPQGQQGGHKERRLKLHGLEGGIVSMVDVDAHKPAVAQNKMTLQLVFFTFSSAFSSFLCIQRSNLLVKECRKTRH